MTILLLHGDAEAIACSDACDMFRVRCWLEAMAGSAQDSKTFLIQFLQSSYSLYTSC
jgi:hypothetical protein